MKRPGHPNQRVEQAAIGLHVHEQAEPAVEREEHEML